MEACVGQRGRRRGELDAGGDVLVHDLLELPDAGADLVDRRGLLLRGRRDLADQVGGPADRRHDLAEQAAGVLGHRDAAAGQLADLVGRLLAPLGELADLAGHHGEPLALGAGAGGLDRGVQGQQVRLVGDVLDDLDLLRRSAASRRRSPRRPCRRPRRGRSPPWPPAPWCGRSGRWPSPRCPRPPGSRRSPASVLACSVAPCDSCWALALSSVLAEETEAVAWLISVITSTSLSIRALTCAESSPNSSPDVSDDRTSRWPCSR